MQCRLAGGEGFPTHLSCIIFLRPVSEEVVFSWWQFLVYACEFVCVHLFVHYLVPKPQLSTKISRAKTRQTLNTKVALS